MRKFIERHRTDMVVLVGLCGHQLTMVLVNTEAGERFYFVLEVCRLIFLAG